jgi:hypothetical protein
MPWKTIVCSAARFLVQLDEGEAAADAGLRAPRGGAPVAALQALAAGGAQRKQEGRHVSRKDGIAHGREHGAG